MPGGDGFRSRGTEHIGGEHECGGALRFGECGAEGADGGFGGVVGVVDLAGVFGDRGEERGGVHRLMGAFEAVGAAHGAAQGDDGILFGVGGEQSGGEVGGAGPGGDQHDTWCAGESADGAGHECGVLFVAADDEFRAAVGQGVVDGVDFGARHAEHVGHLVGGEHIDDALGTAGGAIAGHE